MNQKVLEYLSTQRIGVLAVEMPDGAPHGATLHFANSQEPCVFYFETTKGYRKSEALLQKPSTRASFVVGTSEGIMETLQLDGVARIITDTEKEQYESVYYGKFPEKKDKYSQDSLRFVFIPNWWRFTQWKNGEKILITSEDK